MPLLYRLTALIIGKTAISASPFIRVACIKSGESIIRTESGLPSITGVSFIQCAKAMAEGPRRTDTRIIPASVFGLLLQQHKINSKQRHLKNVIA
jgi:hypothetical protein